MEKEKRSGGKWRAEKDYRILPKIFSPYKPEKPLGGGKFWGGESFWQDKRWRRPSKAFPLKMGPRPSKAQKLNPPETFKGGKLLGGGNFWVDTVSPVVAALTGQLVEANSGSCSASCRQRAANCCQRAAVKRAHNLVSL